jgi:cell shape-determining protein MreD
MDIAADVLSLLGFIVRALGFALLGFGVGRFTMDAYKKAAWQVQIALAVGFFGLLVGLTHYSSAGSMGMFALGAGAALLMSFSKKKESDEEEK